MFRVGAVIVGLIASTVAGALVPWAVAHAAGAQPNEWLGLRTGAADGVEARCALGDATGIDRSVSTWVAVGGSRFLDVIQVGAMATPAGHRFFAAYGRGEPGVQGSLYVEVDLGPSDGLPHRFGLLLADDVWHLSIDGETRLRLVDTFRSWPIVSAQVMHEAEGERDDIGGTVERPVVCTHARVVRGTWTRPSWELWGFGPSAATARIDQGVDRFAAWR